MPMHDQVMQHLTRTATVAALVSAVVAVATPGMTHAQSTTATESHPAPDIHLGVPHIVAPGVVSTAAGEEFKATVAPDGRTMVFIFTDRLFSHLTLVQSRLRDGKWSAPEVVPFSGIWRDGDPSFTPDGRALVFTSHRPLPGEPRDVERKDSNLWMVPRSADGRWGEPVAFGSAVNSTNSEFAPSMTLSGTLYFSRGDTIYRAERRGDAYPAPVALPFTGGDPAISADERFLVFDDTGSGPTDADLFVSCRTSTGWSPRRRLAEPLSSRDDEGDPFVTADGRSLYFFSRRHPPVPQHAPLAKRATYAGMRRAMLTDPADGTRNIYEADISMLTCP